LNRVDGAVEIDDGERRFGGMTGGLTQGRERRPADADTSLARLAGEKPDDRINLVG